MSSKKYVSPLQFEVRSSRTLFILLLFLHGLSLAVLVALEYPAIITYSMIAVILISFILSVRHHAMKKTASSIVEIRWDDNDHWDVTTRMGRIRRVSLLGDTFMSPSFGILLLKRSKKSFFLFRLFPESVVLLRDNTNSNLFRHLRVRLKVKKSSVDYN